MKRRIELRKAQSLSEGMSPSALKLLTSSGDDLVHRVGVEVVRGVVLDVLTGRNLRDSTEMLTRRRIAALNLATVAFFLRGAAASPDFARQLPYHATRVLTGRRPPRAERWMAQWMLGLTDKAIQNVLRDDPNLLVEYRNQYIQACRDVIAAHVGEFGDLTGVVQMGSSVRAEVTWLLVAYLLNAIGAQTLTIRGSEKSAYGKLFEKLVLGSLLHILGFKFVVPGRMRRPHRVFWLATRHERRESDATLLYEAGKGVRFDIGFIGRGNPEISLDKVTRFERELSLGRSRWYMATLIIVDRIGARSRLSDLAARVGGTLVQMSAGYWPQQVARELERVLGFTHALVDMKPSHIRPYLEEQLRRAPLERFLGFGGNGGARGRGRRP